MSRAALAKKIGLTRAAITIIVDSLISDGIIIEKGTVSAGIGRNPMILDIKPDCHFALGLNLSRDKCSLGAINAKGIVIKSKKLELKLSEGSAQTLPIIENEIKEFINSLDISNDKLLGLGVTAPGPLDSSKGIIINPPNFDKWEKISIVDELKKCFDFPIMLENNASASAIAEKNYGAAKNFSDFILLMVDTGIGAGIITKNSLYKGANSLGAELGHTTIVYNGKKCSCGNSGCLEVYASVPAIVEQAKKIDPEVDDWKKITERAQAGDEGLLGIIDTEAQYLAASIVSAVNIMGIEAVILSGYITYKPELLLKALSDKVNSHAINRDLYKTNILVSEIDNDSAIIAAASIIFENLL